MGCVGCLCADNEATCLWIASFTGGTDYAGTLEQGHDMVATTSRSHWKRLLQTIGILGVLAVAVINGPAWWSTRATDRDTDAKSEKPQLEHAADGSESLIVPTDTVRGMKLASRVVARTEQTKPLRLTGQLMLDPIRLVHVSSRFDGEVVRIEEWPAMEKAAARRLRIGDRVQKGQLLAVVWSKEIGEKKSDLVDALSQLALHEMTYKKLKSLEKSGGVPQRTIDEMQQTVESNIIQVERLRRTLRSWRLDEIELTEVEAEAQRIHAYATTRLMKHEKPQCLIRSSNGPGRRSTFARRSTA